MRHMRYRVLFAVFSQVITGMGFIGPMVGPLSGAASAATSAPASVAYQPPVPGPVVDGWRPPAGPYGAGNRGIDYATSPGAPIGATADGAITFAGQVAGVKWVVISHADGRRSSLGPLAQLLVRAGQQVMAGSPVGTAAQSAIHWGVREATIYIDPGTLLPGRRGKLRLTK
jgi:murein DD-endopeptidase MepM/ murein hydrolase activator NlpD